MLQYCRSTEPCSFMAETDHLYLDDADTIVDDKAAQSMLEIKYDDEVAFRSSQERIISLIEYEAMVSPRSLIQR